MNNIVRIAIVISLLAFIGVAPAFGQSKIKIDKAERLTGGKDAAGNSYRKLIGDVQLVQGNTRIFGDSVIYYQDRNFTEVFGDIVRIEEGDTIVVTGGQLRYDGDNKIAEMRDNVIYRDPSMTLYTDFLDYNLADNIAYYYNGGKLVDTTNVLTSRLGNYRTATNLAAFKDSVVLVNPEYTLEADTLEYNTATQVAYTRGPTVITSEDSTQLNAEAGSEISTTDKQSIFGLGTIETDAYLISADRLFADELNKRYNATSNVEMVSKEQDVIIIGDSAFYQLEEGVTKIYGNPVMKKVMEGDTLYLAADTLVSVEDSIPANERILAYPNVRIYRSDLQGIADSLAYNLLDSMLFFYQDPVLWAQGSQIEADSINIELVNGQIHKMNATDNSFVVSTDTLSNFNQIKGRDMEAFFNEGNISNINVHGNGESIYFPLQGDSVIVAMNRILCSDIYIYFDENELSSIKFDVKPEGKFIPPHEITPEETKLDGFAWRIEERPTLETIFNYIPPDVPGPPPINIEVKPVPIPTFP
ncbi:OstA-like protein [Tunicatimonas pelagia]|uniref:OstA-like protein n=1 Tax=Tunicatimonas pelagia TaxID=931531 RepID=UPI00266577A8|nr:OstA-like protein [Tunicatimonas pelagia]WKN42304.1 OstA-like protein [Tunicatimonas pelagia]